MNITTTSIVLFSPTGTSRKVAQAVADDCRCVAHLVDATYSVPEHLTFDSNALVFMSVPVYGGKVAPLALQRLEAMKGNNTPIVLIVVYGNRAYEGAMVQLDAFVRQRGFVPIAAGAFVGEHSYSTPAMPIAKGRPDATDLSEARTWGLAIREKISYIASPVAVDVARLKAPSGSLFSKLRFMAFVLQQRNKKKPVVKPVPIVDNDKCRSCGKCARLCPNGAISADGKTTNPDLCIKCCACVKSCPLRARTFVTPYAPVLSQCFKSPKSPVTLV